LIARVEFVAESVMELLQKEHTGCWSKVLARRVLAELQQPL
jgi:hypothetical protein